MITDGDVDAADGASDPAVAHLHGARHGPTLRRFTVPAGSFFVSSLLSVVVFLGVIDRVLLPLWRRLTGGHTPTPLQRIGAGHVLTVAAWPRPARRRSLAPRHRARAREEGNPAWGVTAGDAGTYQEFPPPLKNTATGMVAVLIALGFYLSTAFVDVVRRTTSWLPDT
ncbi:hypothetical protein GUJ93_ZPchr0010g8922 [Zizania palustris]|uniref:Uncharacterized protein n=1 Tax=Zizania palustris TaxID=103762 RepID=A0A8J5W948_ZIZPA|nr:hypothetical protein GUJ93_ZPchr0010g8922 [Zizania palustris]